MNVTREQIVAAAQAAQDLMKADRRSVWASAFLVRDLDTDESAQVTAMAGFLFGEAALHNLGENVVAVRDDHGHFVALMPQETYEALMAMPAGSFEPRLYVAEPPQLIRKPQPPFWANDWRRGRKRRGR